MDEPALCVICNLPLGDSPSDFFCSQEHQRVWMERQATELKGMHYSQGMWGRYHPPG